MGTLTGGWVGEPACAGLRDGEEEVVGRHVRERPGARRGAT